jgi:hypothetical protein
MKRKPNPTLWAAFAACCLLALTAGAQDLNQVIQQKVAALKESTAQNQQVLRQYTWIEKTELSLKGEVKSTKIESCRYGPDGTVQKTELTEPAKEEKKRGLKGRIIENKKEDMKDYMERTIALIGRYVPPSPENFKAVVAAGNTSVSQAGPGAIQIQFKDFVKSGDSVTFATDTAAKMIRQISVNTYLDDQDKDAIVLTVSFQTLPDGTSYAASKVLNVAAKKIVVKTTGSNFQKLAK